MASVLEQHCLEMANHVRRHVGQLDHGRDHNPSAAPLPIGPRRVARRPDERPQRGGRCSSAGLAKSGCCWGSFRMIPTSVARLFPPPSSVPRPSTLVMFLDAPAPPSMVYQSPVWGTQHQVTGVPANRPVNVSMRPPAAPGPHYISPAALCVHLLLHRRPIYYFSGASRDMLICGRCNPPPVDDPNYRGCPYSPLWPALWTHRDLSLRQDRILTPRTTCRPTRAACGYVCGSLCWLSVGQLIDILAGYSAAGRARAGHEAGGQRRLGVGRQRRQPLRARQVRRQTGRSTACPRLNPQRANMDGRLAARSPPSP